MEKFIIDLLDGLQAMMGKGQPASQGQDSLAVPVHVVVATTFLLMVAGIVLQCYLVIFLYLISFLILSLIKASKFAYHWLLARQARSLHSEQLNEHLEIERELIQEWLAAGVEMVREGCNN